MPNTKQKVFTLGELFSGPGGIGCGAQAAQVMSADGTEYFFRHAWANDYDNASCETYRSNIAIDPHHVYCEPVEDFVDRFPYLSHIDGLTFGFPCNDYSNIGEKKGLTGTFGPLFEFGAQALDHFEPSWFLAENVGGLSNANAGKAFSRILERLAGAGPGYALNVHLYRFEHYGVPQKRHRIVIVGMRQDRPFRFLAPAPTHRLEELVTAREALERSPDVHSLPNSELTRQAPHVVERLRYIQPGQNAWTAKLPERLQLNVKGARLSNIYRRLQADQPSYTITGSGGGGTHVYHYQEPRALTNRERARLQTFPDNYTFHGSKEEVRRQIGMAVPPLGARIILEAILKTLAGIHYPHVPAHWTIYSDG